MANSDLLSQDEIDALLSGVDSGEVETEVDEALPSGDGEKGMSSEMGIRYRAS